METTTLETVCESLGITIGVRNGHFAKDDDGWEHVASTVTLSRDGKEFWTGGYQQGTACLSEYGLRYLRGGDLPRRLHGWKEPTVPDVMASLLLDGSAHFDSQDFEDWAIDNGYDTDSRKAERTYQECLKTGRALSRAFTPAELEALREAANDY